MDHAEAEQARAVERYALGDLSVSEVEDFERHFFDCPQCSEELRLLSIFQDNARAVFSEPRADFIGQSSTPSILPAALPISEVNAAPVWATPTSTPPPVRPRRWWNNWGVTASAFAMVVLGLVLSYREGARSVNEAQVVDAHALYAASRGAETVITPAPGAQFYTLYMDRTWENDFASYRAVVRDDTGQLSAAGTERLSMPVPPPAQGHAIYVLLPAHALPPARYVLAILGKDSAGQETTAAEYRFTLRFPVN